MQCEIGPKTVTLATKVPEEFRDRVFARAKSEGMTVSNWLFKLANKALQEA